MVGSRPALALVATLVSLACSGPPPRTVSPSRPLDERRAIDLISEAFRDEHDRAVPGGNLPLSDTQSLHVDVSGQDRKYGVAYVTATERIAVSGRESHVPGAIRAASAAAFGSRRGVKSAPEAATT